ncbi:MAG: hypothetical protein V4739_02610 [Pseudomonadota bacterium]
MPLKPSRVHLSRLMALWRSAGWPSRDAVEIDLLAAGWVTLCQTEGGHEILRLTTAGIELLAQARQGRQRARSPHDRLAHRLAVQLISSGRMAWRELSLRAQVPVPTPCSDTAPVAPDGDADAVGLWAPDSPETLALEAQAVSAVAPALQWRMARPDVFSIRQTSVERYLQPMVHEVKVSRADLLSDLRHHAKRASYQWLCCECYYVFPSHIATLDEIPEALGVWVVHGDVDTGPLELVRPARHAACTLPFAVWMALAQATPLRLDPGEAQAQGHLGGTLMNLPDPDRPAVEALARSSEARLP